MSHGDVGVTNRDAQILVDLLEPASGHTIYSALRAVRLAHEIDYLFDLSKHVHCDVPDDISVQPDTPEQVGHLLDVRLLENSNVCYTPAQLLSWDLLSEPLCLSGPVDSAPEQLNHSSSEDYQRPGETINVPSVLENPIPHVPVSCEGNCNGNLIGPHVCKRDGNAVLITCRSSSCTAGFTTKHGFNRHCQSVHKLGKPIDCTVAGCDRVGTSGFTRRDNMIQHLREVHEVDAPIRKYRMNGKIRGYGH